MPEEIKVELVQNPEEEVINVTIPIACLGTGEHSSEFQSLITSFYKRLSSGGDTEVFPHLLNGIGSAPVEGKIGGQVATENDPLQEFATRPMLGTYVPEFSIDANNNVKVDVASNGPASAFRQAYAQFTGEGYANAFDEIMALYKAVKKHCEEKYPGKKIHYTIPMTGFSRGANICKETPNFFAEMLDPAEQENISFFQCLFDPVPGGSRIDNAWSQKFPKMVKEAWVVLSKDEPNHVVFQESNKMRDVVEDPTVTKVHYQILNGDHSFPVCPRVPDPKKDIGLMSSGTLALDTFLRFCSAAKLKLNGKLGVTYYNGEGFKEHQVDAKGEAVDAHNHVLSNDQKLAEYTKQKLTEPLFDSMFERTFLRPFKGLRRELRKKEQYFLHGTIYFSDQEHMSLFANKYPAFFDYYFQMNVAGATSAEVLEDFHKIASDKSLLTSLENAKIISTQMEQKAAEFKEKNKNVDPNITKLANFKPILGAPKGIPVDHKTFYSNDALMNLKNSVLEIVNAVRLGRDTSVSQLTARKVYLGLMHILKGKNSEEEKIFLIKTFLGKLTLHPKYAGTNFVLKMTGLIDDSNINAASAIVMLQNAADSIGKFQARNPNIQGPTDELVAQIEQASINIRAIVTEKYDAKTTTLSPVEFDKKKTQKINEVMVRFQYKNLITLSQREHEEKRELRAVKTSATQAGVQDQSVIKHKTVLAANYYRNLKVITQKIIKKTQAFMTFQKIDNEPADNIIKSLNAYLNRSNWFRNQELSDQKASLAKNARVAIMQLKSMDKGSDLILLKQSLLELQVESRKAYLAAGKGPGQLDILVHDHLKKINEGIYAQASKIQRASIVIDSKQVEASDKQEAAESTDGKEAGAAAQHEQEVRGLKRNSMFLPENTEEEHEAKRPRPGN